MHDEALVADLAASGIQQTTIRADEVVSVITKYSHVSYKLLVDGVLFNNIYFVPNAFKSCSEVKEFLVSFINSTFENSNTLFERYNFCSILCLIISQENDFNFHFTRMLKVLL